MSKVVHCKREAFDIYIGRPSKWGNPFSHKEGTLAKYKVANVQESILKYKEWILTQQDLLDSIKELDGKILGCWCKIKGHEPCHGDVLIELLDRLKCNLN